MNFQAAVIPSGNATGIEIPDTVIQALGPEGRAPIVITINGHSRRSRLMEGHGNDEVVIPTS